MSEGESGIGVVGQAALGMFAMDGSYVGCSELAGSVMSYIVSLYIISELKSAWD
jgi:hypothetical protein